MKHVQKGICQQSMGIFHIEGLRPNKYCIQNIQFYIFKIFFFTKAEYDQQNFLLHSDLETRKRTDKTERLEAMHTKKATKTLRIEQKTNTNHTHTCDVCTHTHTNTYTHQTNPWTRSNQSTNIISVITTVFEVQSSHLVLDCELPLNTRKQEAVLTSCVNSTTSGSWFSLTCLVMAASSNSPSKSLRPSSNCTYRVHTYMRQLKQTGKVTDRVPMYITHTWNGWAKWTITNTGWVHTWWPSWNTWASQTLS